MKNYLWQVYTQEELVFGNRPNRWLGFAMADYFMAKKLFVLMPFNLIIRLGLWGYFNLRNRWYSFEYENLKEENASLTKKTQKYYNDWQNINQEIELFEFYTDKTWLQHQLAAMENKIEVLTKVKVEL